MTGTLLYLHSQGIPEKAGQAAFTHEDSIQKVPKTGGSYRNGA